MVRLCRNYRGAKPLRPARVYPDKRPGALPALDALICVTLLRSLPLPPVPSLEAGAPAGGGGDRLSAPAPHTPLRAAVVAGSWQLGVLTSARWR